ncbi:MAG: hypothetical protein Fur0010_00020 [Bdellovibrio sp.]
MSRFIIILFSFLVMGATKPSDEKQNGLFSGRISRVNISGALMRVKIDFVNMKYINKRDKVEFWDQRTDRYRCKGVVVGKSNEYVLLKVPDIDLCSQRIGMAPGTYLYLFSQDLVNNIKMGRELVDVLLKKRLALQGKMGFYKQELDINIEKVNAVNLKYKTLRDKLELEWRNELQNLDEDNAETLKNYKQLELQLSEVDKKLEAYRIGEDNLAVDRWALDPRLYYKK